ncbi:MAG: hypothetical protein OEN23_20995, partial [Paracoccaceae bacterium]|nr:hypothetical protein [Paracoccaceae bacterium]
QGRRSGEKREHADACDRGRDRLGARILKHFVCPPVSWLRSYSGCHVTHIQMRETNVSGVTESASQAQPSRSILLQAVWIIRFR